MKISVLACLLLTALSIPAMAISRPVMEASPATNGGGLNSSSETSPRPLPPNPERQKTERPEAWLGIVPMPMTPALIAQLDLNGNAGVLVHSVGPDSPAKKAGLRQYDVVLHVKGSPIRCPRDIAKSLLNSKAGEKIMVEIVRAAKKQNLEVILEKRPENMAKVDGVMTDCDEYEQGSNKATLKKLPGQNGRARVMPLVRPQTPSSRLNRGQMDDAMRDMEAQMNQWSDFMKKNMMDMSLFDDQNPASLRAGLLQRMKDQLNDDSSMAAPLTSSSSLFNFNISDGNGSIRLSRNNNKTTITATDRSGKVTFSGPYDTDAERAVVPTEVRERLENVSFMDN